MPPKKKGPTRGKTKGKKKDVMQLELEDKYKRTVDEIAALKDHLALRRELTRRSKSAGAHMTRRVEDTEKELEEHKETQKAINADMTRQYKTMQAEMGLRIYQLDTELRRTQKQLSTTEDSLKKSNEDKNKISEEKDAEISDLRLKINSMEQAYESVIRELLDNLMRKLDLAKETWENKSSKIQIRNKQTLLDFGLKPLDF